MLFSPSPLPPTEIGPEGLPPYVECFWKERSRFVPKCRCRAPKTIRVDRMLHEGFEPPFSRLVRGGLPACGHLAEPCVDQTKDSNLRTILQVYTGMANTRVWKEPSWADSNRPCGPNNA